MAEDPVPTSGASGTAAPKTEPVSQAQPGGEIERGAQTQPVGGWRAVFRDIAGFLFGAALWTGVLSLPWMQAILDQQPFLLWPLIPLIVLFSGLIAMVAVRYRFLAAEGAWVVGLVVGGGLGRELLSAGGAGAWRMIFYSAAWYALLYAPLVLLGIWVVDRVRGEEG